MHSAAPKGKFIQWNSQGVKKNTRRGVVYYIPSIKTIIQEGFTIVSEINKSKILTRNTITPPIPIQLTIHYQQASMINIHVAIYKLILTTNSML